MEPLRRVTPATLDVLAVLQHSSKPIWGLAVIKSSARPAGSVYPILERLERAGWVESEWADEPERPGPRRRYYELTRDGALAARALLAARASRSVTMRTATP
jgi:DNA-binding PadR family transcriptional regulator